MLHTPVMSVMVIVWTWPHATYLSDVYHGYCLNMATCYIPQWCLSWLLSEHDHMLHTPVMSVMVIVWTWPHATYLSDVYRGYCLNMATCYIPQWCLSWLLSEHGHMLHTSVMSIMVIVWTLPHAIYPSDVCHGYCLNMATCYIPQWCLSWLLSEHGHMRHTPVMSVMVIVWTWPHATYSSDVYHSYCLNMATCYILQWCLSWLLSEHGHMLHTSVMSIVVIVWTWPHAAYLSDVYHCYCLNMATCYILQWCLSWLLSEHGHMLHTPVMSIIVIVWTWLHATYLSYVYHSYCLNMATCYIPQWCLSWLLSENGRMLYTSMMFIVVIVWTWPHATYLSDVYRGYCLNMATCCIPQWCLSWLLSEHGHMLHTSVMSNVVIVWTWPHASYLSDVYHCYCLNMATCCIPQLCLSWLLSEHGHMLHTSVMSIIVIVWTWPHATYSTDVYRGYCLNMATCYILQWCLS